MAAVATVQPTATAPTFGAVERFANVVPAVALVTALAEHLAAVGVGEFADVVVVTVTGVLEAREFTDFATAHRVALDRVRVFAHRRQIYSL